ncbi:hypothetical protein FGSG_07738 [Fusarium graminearum PH-1]|uniref:Chromosome 4, complete genome n=1 Tax=Gibberella zeae (strain ATCC MYA-4620 / CBS 123657 / FGSC 9075 / NRRL 31084 / PH-1) TaxID=229533 RepID=I1RU56_GIBZE|nr:hypothetical protein FGSG_07738 [Fusarium graminearum PH-1]ESU14040.1 hypothetical protein FGSG_07738 [Fusarium graminearum PH-1]EYB30304.1 hypothetical protein FG05_07738 [Fusarium graminearum]CEF84684.1 unnamed protein product [Fusarium graminearum]|eukprot:XP_011327547.1 hypothetical protein FGSG_07738 [Fusarium graminearum PH-1]
MSGFEVVGVVLGSIPLLISGLEHYRNGMETIGNMVQYIEVVENILDSISTTLAIYRQSCEVLLEGLILPEDILAELLNNSSSTAWSNQELVEQLKKQFGPHREYEVYKRAVIRLNKRIEKFRSKLDLDESFQPRWVQSNSVDANLLGKFFNSGRDLRRRLKIGFNGERYMELADAIESDVTRISTLIGGARTLEPIRTDLLIMLELRILIHHGNGNYSRSNRNWLAIRIIHDETWEHYLYLINPRDELRNRDGFSSLEEILRDAQLIGTKTKFGIAAALASDVLQFHATAWLNDQWDSRDRFGHQEFARFSSKHRGPSVSNQMTFALGVALIELSYSKRLLDFQEPGDLDENGNVDILTRLEIAKRLVGRIEKRDGGKYVDVLDRCIRFFDHSETYMVIALI